MSRDLGRVHRWLALLATGCMCLGEPVFAQPAVRSELAELYRANAALKNGVDALTDLGNLVGRGAAGPQRGAGLSLARQGVSNFAPQVLSGQLDRLTRAVTNVTVPTFDSELGRLLPDHRVAALFGDRPTTRHDAFEALLGDLRSLHGQKRRMHELQTELGLLQQRIDVASDVARELADSFIPLAQAPILGLRENATAAVGYFLLDLPERLARVEREIATKGRQVELFLDQFGSDGFANLLGNIESYLMFDRATINVDGMDAAALQRNGRLFTALSQLDWRRPDHSYHAGKSTSAIAYNQRSANNARWGSPRLRGGLFETRPVPTNGVTSVVEVAEPTSGVTPYVYTPAERRDRAAHEARRAAHDHYRREWKRDAAAAARGLREAMSRIPSGPPPSDPSDPSPGSPPPGPPQPDQQPRDQPSPDQPPRQPPLELPRR